MHVFAHRGANKEATENTVEAFARARALGVHGVELDVQRCRTGEVVVFHDTDLERLAGRPARIADTSFAELRALRLDGGGRIPTLPEVYEACGPAMWVNVELKIEHLRPTGLEAATVAELRRAGGLHRTIFSCFHPVGLWRVRRLAPGVPRALLFGESQSVPLRRGWLARMVPISRVHPEDVLVDAARVRAWHGRGLEVHAWTVDDPARVRELAAMGVDGVITNRPGLARDALMGIAGVPGWGAS